MAQYRSSSPISGFGGHIPGNKWHVGSRPQGQREEHGQTNARKTNTESTLNDTLSNNSYEYYGFPNGYPPGYPQGYPPGYPVPYGQYIPNGYFNQFQRNEETNGEKEINGERNGGQNTSHQGHVQNNSPFSTAMHTQQHEHERNQRNMRLEANNTRAVRETTNSIRNETNFSKLPTELAVNTQEMNSQRSFNGYPPPGAYPYYFYPMPYPPFFPPPPSSQFSSPGFPASVQHVHELSGSTQNLQNNERISESGFKENGLEKSENMRRSQSVPKKKVNKDLKDPFDGIEGGWWSEGQALKNMRKHENMLRGPSNETSNGSRKKTRGPGLTMDDDDIPTSGYSGHIPGFKIHSVGKPFNVAANDCLKHMREDYKSNINLVSNR